MENKNFIKKVGSKILISVKDLQLYYDYKDNSFTSEHGNKIVLSTFKSKLTGVYVSDLNKDISDINYLKLLEYIEANEYGTRRPVLSTVIWNLKKYEQSEKFYCLGIYISGYISKDIVKNFKPDIMRFLQEISEIVPNISCIHILGYDNLKSRPVFNFIKKYGIYQNLIVWYKVLLKLCVIEVII